MSSNLKVNTILPSTGTTIGIGTVGGLINVVGNIDVNSTSGISTFNGLEISGIVTAKAGAAVTYYGDGSNLTGITDNVVTINNNANNRIITGSGSANTLEGEANLTFDGSTQLKIAGSGQQQLVIGSTDAGGAAVIFDGDSNGDGAGGDYSLIRHNTDGDLEFYARSTGGATNTIFKQGTSEKLRITSDGKMGLGIASPTGQFAVSDGTRIAEINPHSSGTFIGNRSNHDVLFQVNAATKAKIDTNGHLTISDGNLIVASGHGIDFSATYDGSNVSNVTATSELLDDYEEGTFQPVLKRLMANNSTETNFYNQGTRAGNYTRIGDRVWITGAIYWNGGSTGSGSVILTNLPFTVNSGTANDGVPLVVGFRSGWNYRDMTGYSAGNMNRFYLAYYDSSGTYNISPGATATQGTLYFSANYELV